MTTLVDYTQSEIFPGPLFVHETTISCTAVGQNIGNAIRLFAAGCKNTLFSCRQVAIGMPRFVVVAGGPQAAAYDRTMMLLAVLSR